MSKILALYDCPVISTWKTVILMRFGEYYIDKGSPKEQRSTTTGSSFLKRTFKEALWEPWQSNCIWESVKASNTSTNTMRARGENFGPPYIETAFLIGDPWSPKYSFRVRDASPMMHSRSGFYTSLLSDPIIRLGYRNPGQIHTYILHLSLVIYSFRLVYLREYIIRKFSIYARKNRLWYLLRK